MSKRAATSGTAVAGALLLAMSAGEAAAQQGYYPQAGNSPVTINYGALSPYAAPGYQPYGGVAYGAPGYASPAYASQGSQFMPGQYPAGQMAAPLPAGMPVSTPLVTGGPGYSPITYTASPIQAPFVAPYGNPAYPQGQAGLVPGGAPQSYLNVPGQAPMALMGMPQPGAKPFDPNNMKSKKRKAASQGSVQEASAVEAAAAAQVAAVEEQLEANVAPAAPAVAPAEPTPPAAPAEVPASVPSPVEDAAVITPPAASSEPAAAETAPAETAPAETEAAGSEAATTEPAVIEPPAAETATTEAATEEAAAEEPAAGGTSEAVLPGNGTRIVFEPDADELPATATGQLDAIAASMMSDENVKVQVLAYASGSGDNESQARRKALSRGLEVRKYLINKGVRSNRIDVRALGSKSEGSPADRVDIVPAANAG